jgi:hypothetical protein
MRVPLSDSYTVRQKANYPAKAALGDTFRTSVNKSKTFKIPGPKNEAFQSSLGQLPSQPCWPLQARSFHSFEIEDSIPSSIWVGLVRS